MRFHHNGKSMMRDGEEGITGVRQTGMMGAIQPRDYWQIFSHKWAVHLLS